MATDKSSESTQGNTDSGASTGKPKTVAPNLLKDIKGKNTTRDKIQPNQRFL